MVILMVFLSLSLVSANDVDSNSTASVTGASNNDLSTNMGDTVLTGDDNSNLIKEDINADIEQTNNDDNEKQFISNKNNTLKTASKKITPTIRLSDYSIYRNQTSTFYARIMDENATGTAIFKINGITISDKLNVQNGIVSTDFTVPINWGLQQHTLTFVYAGNDKYKEARVNSTLTLEYDSDRLDSNLKSSN